MLGSQLSAIFATVLIFYFTSSCCAKNESDVLSACGTTAFCVLDPPGCTSLKDCKIAAVFSKLETPNQLSVKLRVRDPDVSPYALLRFVDAASPNRMTFIYCSPGPKPLEFGFVPSEQSGTLMADKDTTNKLGRIEDVSISDGVFSCDFVRTIRETESIQEASSIVDEQIITIAAGSREADGKYGKPTVEFENEGVVRFSDVLDAEKMRKKAEDGDSKLELDSGNKKKGSAFLRSRNGNRRHQDEEAVAGDDDDDDGEDVDVEGAKGKRTGVVESSGSHLVISAFVTVCLVVFLTIV